MKKHMILILLICFLLTGCGSDPATAETTEPLATTAATEQAAAASRIYPLPDTTNLSDGILSVSLEEGNAFVDDTGKMQMDVTVYTYDKYDMVDIAMLNVGDILATHDGDVEITALERKDDGTVLINGGLEENGFDLITDETGVFYEQGYSDAKNWYELGKTIIRVSVDFVYHDTSDLDAGEILYYPGDFLIGAVTDYRFSPYNTTIRVENGQIMEMFRVYTP